MPLSFTERKTEYQDEVKNRKTGVLGVVIAKYPHGDETYLDVRGADNKIYYFTHISKWEFVRSEEERV